MRRWWSVVLLASGVACGARTGLGDEPYNPDALTCSTVTVAVRPNVATRLYAGLPRRLWGMAQWRVERLPMGASPTLTHDGGEAATFRADLEGDYVLRVSVPSSSPDAGVGATDSCTLTVRVRASGPTALCPAEVTTSPLTAVQIDGNATGDRPITSTQWTLQAAPTSSARPAPTPADAVRTTFTPDVAGDYTLRLRVTDANDARDECTTLVHAVPHDGLRVELSWDPPSGSCPRNEGAACDQSDVDLHLLLNSGGGDVVWQTDNDCYYANCQVRQPSRPRWGMSGLDDDPRLDLDDVTGHGPENINITRPSARSYRIGVHYYASHGAGDQVATVTVYCGGAGVVARLGPQRLRGGEQPTNNDFWLAADVIPTATSCEVRPIRRADGSAYVYADSEAAQSAGPPPP